MSTAIAYHALLAAGGIAAVILIGLLLRTLLRTHPIGRYWVSRTTLIVAIAIVPVQILGSGFADRPAPAALAVSTAALTEPLCDAPTGIAAIVGTAAECLPVATPTTDATALRRDSLWPDYAPWALIAAALGACISLGFLARRALRTRAMLSAAATITDDHVLSLWREVAGAAARRVRLVRSAAIASPACAGVLRPVIILPSDALERISGEDLTCALEHEALHLRRRDSLFVLAAELLCACAWFHPLVHMLRRRLAEDREESCDAALVQRRGHAHTYARALLAFEELRMSLRSTSRCPAYLLAGFSSCTSLERRLTVIEQASARSGMRRWALVTAVGAVIMAAVLPGHVALSRAAGAAPLLPQSGAKQNAAADPAEVKPIGNWQGVVRRAEIAAPIAIRNGARAVWNLERLGAPAGGTITDQETILSAVGAERRDATLEATEIRLSLPEGSKLKAVVEGESVSIEKADDKTSLLIKAGSIRIVDDSGVSRITLSTPPQPEGVKGAISATVGMASGEVELIVRANGFQNVVMLRPTGAPVAEGANAGRGGDGLQLSPEVRAAPLRVALNLSEGVPADEKQPPHNAVRYELQTPRDAQKDPTRVKMQWIYDVEKSRAEGDGC